MIQIWLLLLAEALAIGASPSSRRIKHKHHGFQKDTSGAVTPAHYEAVYRNLNVANHDERHYLGSKVIKTYDPQCCADWCNELQDCKFVNMFYQNMEAGVTIKCSAWSKPGCMDTATNSGRYSEGHAMWQAIAGSNGYSKLPAKPVYEPYAYHTIQTTTTKASSAVYYEASVKPHSSFIYPVYPTSKASQAVVYQTIYGEDEYTSTVGSSSPTETVVYGVSQEVAYSTIYGDSDWTSTYGHGSPTETIEIGYAQVMETSTIYSDVDYTSIVGAGPTAIVYIGISQEVDSTTVYGTNEYTTTFGQSSPTETIEVDELQSYTTSTIYGVSGYTTTYGTGPTATVIVEVSQEVDFATVYGDAYTSTYGADSATETIEVGISQAVITSTIYGSDFTSTFGADLATETIELGLSQETVTTTIGGANVFTSTYGIASPTETVAIGVIEYPSNLVTVENIGTCPGANGTIIMGQNGKPYQVLCGVDFYGGDITQTYEDNFADCLQSCTDYGSECIGVIMVPARAKECYLKYSMLPSVHIPQFFQCNSLMPLTLSTDGFCDEINNDRVYLSGNDAFSTQCSTNFVGNTLNTVRTSSFTACMDACAAYGSSCVGVSWDTPSGTCAMKSVVYSGPLYWLTDSNSISAYVGTLNIVYAPTTVTTCPGVDHQLYTVKNGDQFFQRCDMDVYNNNLLATAATLSSFQDCMELCSTTSGCVAVAYAPSNQACFLKSSVPFAAIHTSTTVQTGVLTTYVM